MVEAITAMNYFDLAGQNLRVGRAITPPNCFECTPTAPTSLPTAAAIAAAAATAKIQAMDAVASTTNGSNTGSTLPTTTGISTYQFGQQPVMASSAPGLITGVTITPVVGSNSPLIIPPPTLVTSLPLSIKSMNNNNTNNNTNSIITSSTIDSSNGVDVKVQLNENGNSNQHLMEIGSKLNEPSIEDGQTLQQQENVVIKGSNARQVLMHKLMRKNEVRLIYFFI